MNSVSLYNRLVMKLSMMTGLNLNKPVYIAAQMTMRCNSRCAHCNVWKMEPDGREMSTQEWLTTLDGLNNWLGSFRIFFSGGEALLRSDMPDIIDYAVKRGIIVELLSNGIDLDDGLARRIVEAGIDQITLSLDGMTPEVHDRFRGGDGYHARTMAAILALIRYRESSSKNLKILAKTVISANNLHELVPLASWAQEQGIDIQFQPIEQNYGDIPDHDWYRTSRFWITDLTTLRDVMTSLCRMKEQGLSSRNSCDDFKRFYEYFEQPKKLMSAIQGHDSNRHKKYCPHAVGNFAIASNGDVRMCFMMEPIGNVTSQNPQAIWKGRKHCWAGPCDFR